MPKLWTETVETHRQEVREAILDATGSLVQSRGLLAVTMSDIAEATGIGRATLYKYFPDVEMILSAWHQRQLRADASSALKKLAALELDASAASNPADERCRPGPWWPPETNITTTMSRASPSAVTTNTLTHRGTPAVQRILPSRFESAGGPASPGWCSTSFILIFSMTTTISTGRWFL